MPINKKKEEELLTDELELEDKKRNEVKEEIIAEEALPYLGFLPRF